MSKKFDVGTVVNERKNELDSSPLFQVNPAPQKAARPAPPSVVKKPVRKAIKSDSMNASVSASMIATDETIELIRKAVKRTGEKVAYIRLTKEEKAAIKDIIYTYDKQDIETSENEIGRIGLKWIIEDYKANGQNSILAKVLAALND